MIALNRNGIRDKHDKRISFSFQVATTGPSLPTSSDLFCETGISALEAARHHQNRLDGTHTLDTHMANKSGKMTVKPLSNAVRLLRLSGIGTTLGLGKLTRLQFIL